MKSKEIKRKEAEARQAASTFVAPENPCVRCKHYKRPRCNYHNIFTGRKNTCDNWEK